jgi:hypothetical protein
MKEDTQGWRVWQMTLWEHKGAKRTWMICWFMVLDMLLEFDFVQSASETSQNLEVSDLRRAAGSYQYTFIAHRNKARPSE